MSHYGKCKHGVYLDGCRKCFPLPELTKVGEEIIQELAECFNEDKEMTANELVDELISFMTEDEYTDLDKTIFKTVNMLRTIPTLKKEIAMLKQIIDANNLQSDIGQFIRPIDEPVAWIAIGDNTSVFFDLDCALSIDDNPTPLYTHPAKTLTDGEILNIYLEQTNGNKDLDILEFAKLILKKAGEK